MWCKDLTSSIYGNHRMHVEVFPGKIKDIISKMLWTDDDARRVCTSQGRLELWINKCKFLNNLVRLVLSTFNVLAAFELFLDSLLNVPLTKLDMNIGPYLLSCIDLSKIFVSEEISRLQAPISDRLQEACKCMCPQSILGSSIWCFCCVQCKIS